MKSDDKNWKSIEIVVHCYAKERPWYAALFCYQFSSLVLFPPSCNVRLTLFCDPKDEVLGKFLDFFCKHYLFGVDLNVIHKDVSKLGRRAIGRNEASKSTNADIVWYTDPDYVFEQGCLDALSNTTWPDNAVLLFPHSVFEQYPKRIDVPELRDLVERPRLARLAPHEKCISFYSHAFFRAMGSIQIVQGDFARKYGYCPHHDKFQSPTDSPFDGYSSQSDLSFRLGCKRIARNADFQQPVDIPNIYRMSHPSRRHSAEKAKLKCGW